MSRSSPSVCLLCQSSSLLKNIQYRFLSYFQPWKRAASTLRSAQRPRPSRMSLSPRVSRPVEGFSPNHKPGKRRSIGPFGGLNLTSADLRSPPHGRPQAEGRRSSRGRENKRNSTRTPGAYKALKMQRALNVVSYGHRNKVKRRISEIQSFDDFALLPSVRESVVTQALPGLKEITPTPVQRLAIPMLLNDGLSSREIRSQTPEIRYEQFLLAAETGSGKTLAYLLPVVDALKRAETRNAEEQAQEKKSEEEMRKPKFPSHLESPPLSNRPHPTTGRPRIIILVPTAELVTQVGRLVKSLSHKVKYRSEMLSTAYTTTVIRNRLFAPTGIDIVISTPHLLSSIVEADPNILSRVSHLVVDEADSLLDRSFAPSTSAIIDRASPSLQQLIFCSATIPRSLDSYLSKRYPEMHRLVTPNLHAIPRRVQLGVVDIEKEPYRGNRELACADAIWSIGKSAAEHAFSHTPGEQQLEKLDVKRILVFVNEREKTLEVANYLQSKGIDAIALNRDTLDRRQPETLEEFTSPIDETVPLHSTPDLPTSASGHNYIPFSESNHSPPPPSRRELPNTKVLVTTDLGSRGIDTIAVRHVLLYDVPHSSIDFIHRLGRTGRMNRRGRGIILVGKHDRRDVVREVKEGMFMGRALI